ncbi:MAG TPA: helix-turn-helix domain-containing protein [Chthoniobacterales bacterium]
MEPLGKKLQEVRLAKKISLEEAARVTKIRPSRIQEIEAEDFSSFSSLAYAKGFLLIYGKYLDVNVTPYLDAFETSREVTVDGYSYLQESPGSAPLPVVRRKPTRRPALLPFIIALAVLVLGLYFMKLLLDIQRITPRSAAPGAVSVSPTPSPSPPERIVAPRALPVEGTPQSEAGVMVSPSATATAAAAPSPTAPEVRRAQPVHPEDLAPPNEATPPPSNSVQITPLQLTYLRVLVDDNPQPVFDDWLDSSHPPLSFRGHHLRMKVLDRGAVKITKNGAALASGDADVTFE